ncbi:MAG TPA: hypothetical protein VD886_00705 [Herpetosiphonaceae bacterium]|nr:hypothetical protein [Herpetosiphonaceae bacterium]
MADGLQTLVAELERDRSLARPDRLRERIKWLDRLEAYGLDRPGDNAAAARIGAGLYGRARAIHARLESLNEAAYAEIRRAIRRGAGAERLLAWAPGPGAGGEEYDELDVLLNGVVRFVQPDAEVAEPAAEMVFYQPTPARHIFELIARTGLGADDTLLDLGSGLGHVPLLAAICTAARTIGVELEAAYVDCARRSAGGLNITTATFIQADARAADLSAANVFYLYTPFTGTILRDVLDALRRQASRREIRVCAYGPCATAIAREGWLAADRSPEVDRITVFRSRG